MEAKKSIVILDFGGQYAHLIGRRVRGHGVFSEVLPPETKAEDLSHAAGIILSGGPQSVYDAGSPQGDPKIFELGIPVLGICYGLHWMTQTLGGMVKLGKVKEYGRTEIQLIHSTSSGQANHESSITKNLPDRMTVWMSHGDEAMTLPPGFTLLATSDACKHAAFGDESRHFYAVQFHPEVTHTEHGNDILRSFVNLCDADSWSIESYATHIGDQMKRQVGDKQVFMLVSGGVDSTVAFTLLNEVLGTERVQGLLVDTGLMRKNEVKELEKAFEEIGIRNLRVVDASEEFFENLQNVYDPEQKRKIIGQTFLDVQRRVSEEMDLKVEDGWMLGQGTIYPDTVETGETKHADQIKTHHNRIEAIQKMMDEGLVIEPLRDLYKDEVRILGEELKLPHELVWRHPFPGPGLGVRILCAREPNLLSNSQIDISVPYAVLPIRSVGVQGDGRSYRHAVALFSEGKYPTDEHWRLATQIPNTFWDYNRVLFCTSHAAPLEFVFSPGCITRERADLLREADAIVREEQQRSGIHASLWQFPVVLLPFGTSVGGQSVVLRPVESEEAMTANAAVLPEASLRAMTEQILEISGIDIVFQDLTHKPPGTIEWE